MNILIAPDKFKGSLTAQEVCNTIRTALLKLNAALQIQTIALADGGEGTAQLLTDQTGGKWVACSVRDPLFRKVEAGFGLSGDSQTAFIEMASASGLQLLAPTEANPLKTSTIGTGDLIVNAFQQQVKKVVLAIGGSATNDAGMGMAHALGYRFYDHQNRELLPIGENLANVQRVDTVARHPRLSETDFIVLCDVTNPLYGVQGAAHVFAPQKGATHSQVLQLDAGLRNFAYVVETQMRTSLDFAGAGAAGGLGAGASAFLDAIQKRGIDYVMEALQVDEAVRRADLIITGEGKLDTQTLAGKVVAGIAARAKRFHKPVIAVVGTNELPEVQWKKAGLTQVVTLVNDSTPVEFAQTNVRDLISRRLHELPAHAWYKT